jgi:thiol:disulfide interchange protein
MFLSVSALATVGVLAGCSSPAQTPAATSAPALPQATTAPAQNVAAAKPVFIDFYAPW